MQSKIHVIDGGVGTELQRRGVAMNPAYWSAAASLDQPDTLLQVHRDYLAAGATVISTNTFMAGRHVLQAGGRSDFAAINRHAVEIAAQAREAFATSDCLLAGSMSALPPLNQANDMPRGKQVAQHYREQAGLLQDAGVDLLLVEMLIDSESSIELLSACCDTGLPVWAGLSAMRGEAGGPLMTFRQPGKLADLEHETLPSLLQTVCQFPLAALGIMHTELDLMEEALRQLAAVWPGRRLAYAKIGQAGDHDWHFSEAEKPEQYARQAITWQQTHDVSILGGCCGTTPDHLRALTDRLIQV